MTDRPGSRRVGTAVGLDGARGLLAHWFDAPRSAGADLSPSAGPPVLLLNGGLMSIASWEPIASLLGERHPVLRCDFRGQLRTPGPAHRELAPNADDLVALLDALELERVHLFGTSFGGLVGLLLAARHPERVASLVAVTVSDRTTLRMTETTRGLRRVVAGILAGADGGGLLEAMVDDIYSASFRRENRQMLAARSRQVAGLPPAWFESVDGILAAVETFDLGAEAARIRCPTLVVVAADDRVMPPERGRALAAAIPGARLAEHPVSGHTLVVEDPEWLAREALAFLDGLPAAASPQRDGAAPASGRAPAGTAPPRTLAAPAGKET